MQQEIETSNLMTYQDLASFLQRSPNTLRQDVMRRKVPYKKIGKQIRFVKSEIEAWIASKSVPVKERK